MAVLLAAGLGAGCSGNREKAPSLSPQTVSPVASPDATASEAGTEPRPTPDPPPEEGPAPPERDRSGLTIVIDEGEGKSSGPSLIEASRAERERRRETPAAKIVITDENLKEQATGVLTVAAPANQVGPSGRTGRGGSDASGAASTGPPGAPPSADDPRAEDYWKGRALQARLDWRAAADEIERQQETVNRLRRRFYEEDDPYYRDTQIKPAWDRALDRLEEARLLADEARQQLEELLEEGRRAGALPGWLREGIDLEPGRDRQREEGVREYEVTEPEIYRGADDGGER